ncbi:MAG TPA: RNA polymerase factor sigma-54, partial [Methylothermaceae bacterium]|nr:RNA polymerase factor sigma-54 [Methylothermaceae bacterium]
MKQSLQLRLGQQLTMTPQLQQAIRLLQLSSVELKQEIQEALETNFMLELADDEQTVDQPPQPNREERPVDATSEAIPEDLPLDVNWDDVYDNVYSSIGPEEGDNDFLFQRGEPESLHQHLEWQMELAHFSERDRVIATAIIDAINDDGYLGGSVGGIYQDLAAQIADLELDEVVAVLHRIQNFDPPGVAATSLAECLAIQLRQLPEQTPWRQQALKLVTEHLGALENQDIAALTGALGVTEAELEEIVALIRSLHPRPGDAFASKETEYVIPDVFVFKRNGRWIVSLNPEVAPKLRINPYYSSMIRRADKSADNVSLRTHLQEARWFLRSLQSRSETLLRVARCIVEKQQAFFEHGEIAMRAMILRDVAKELGMHESTVSRVTSNKYMHTPRG